MQEGHVVAEVHHGVVKKDQKNFRGFDRVWREAKIRMFEEWKEV